MPKTQFGTHHGVWSKFGTNTEQQEKETNIKCRYFFDIIKVLEAEPEKQATIITE